MGLRSGELVSCWVVVSSESVRAVTQAEGGVEERGFPGLAK